MNIEFIKEELGYIHLLFFCFWFSVFWRKKIAEINTLCCSPLIPLPPVVYGNLLHWFKATFLFEFPFYNCGLPQADSNR
jgi:hypothetical protein